MSDKWTPRIDQNVTVTIGSTRQNIRRSQLPGILAKDGVREVKYFDGTNAHIVTYHPDTGMTSFVHRSISKSWYATKWDEIASKTREIYHQHGYYHALENLVIEDALHGFRRCHMPIVTGSDGVPTKGYCHSVKCWKCGSHYEKIVWQQIVLGCQLLAVNGDIVFATIQNKSRNPDGDKKDFRKRETKLINAWKREARHDGPAMDYCLVTGVKKTTGEIHSHMMTNALLDMTHAPTKGYPNRYRSTWLDELADKLDLVVFAAKATDEIDLTRTAKYTANNLHDSRPYKLPKGLKRARFSNAWVKPHTVESLDKLLSKMDENERNKLTREIATANSILDSTEKDHSDGKLYAHFGNHEPIEIDRVFVPEIIRFGGGLLKIYYNSNMWGEPTKKITIGLTEKQCRKCGVSKPVDNAHFRRSKVSIDGRSNYCKTCRKKSDKSHDVIRVQRFSRQCLKRRKDANQTARTYSLSQRLTDHDISTAYHAENGHCHYCNRALNNHWTIDHMTPFIRHGSNTPENIVAACPKCNAMKGDMPYDDFLAVIMRRYGIVHRNYNGNYTKTMFPDTEEGA